MLRKMLLNKQSDEKNILIMKNKKFAAYLSSYEIHDFLKNSTCVWFGKSKIKKVYKIEFVEFPWNSQENAKASTKVYVKFMDHETSFVKQKIKSTWNFKWQNTRIPRLKFQLYLFSVSWYPADIQINFNNILICHQNVIQRK